MIIVTGQPRCGTSMMMHCLHQAGVPLAFDKTARDDMSEKFRNPHGMYEGKWNGKDGLLKAVGARQLQDFDNPRIVWMIRDAKKINKSWQQITGNKDIPFGKRSKEVRKRIKKALDKFQYITVDYDTFVNKPETYRKDFQSLLPELDFDIIIKGIDKSIYINR